MRRAPSRILLPSIDAARGGTSEFFAIPEGDEILGVWGSSVSAAREAIIRVWRAIEPLVVLWTFAGYEVDALAMGGPGSSATDAVLVADVIGSTVFAANKRVLGDLRADDLPAAAFWLGLHISPRSVPTEQGPRSLAFVVDAALTGWRKLDWVMLTMPYNTDVPPFFEHLASHLEAPLLEALQRVLDRIGTFSASDLEGEGDALHPAGMLRALSTAHWRRTNDVPADSYEAAISIGSAMFEELRQAGVDAFFSNELGLHWDEETGALVAPIPMRERLATISDSFDLDHLAALSFADEEADPATDELIWELFPLTAWSSRLPWVLALLHLLDVGMISCDDAIAPRGAPLTVRWRAVGRNAVPATVKAAIGGVLFASLTPGVELPQGLSVRIAGIRGAAARVRDEGSGLPLGTVHGDDLKWFVRDDDALHAVPLAPLQPLMITGPSDARASLEVYNRIGGLASALADKFDITLAAIVAFWLVESSGRDHVPGQAVIRFENHKFYSEWGATHVDTFDQHFRFEGHAGVSPPPGEEAKRHRQHRYRLTPTDSWQVSHDNQDNEYEALELATRLVNEAAGRPAADLLGQDVAVRAVSIGGPQILIGGDQHLNFCGYPTALEMYEAMQVDERWHLLAFIDFARHKGANNRIVRLLRSLPESVGPDLTTVCDDIALLYNGATAVDEYSPRIEAAYLAAAEVFR